MANHQRNAAKELQWREVMKRQAASGLSVRDFCRREGLSEPSFYAWRRRIRQRDGGQEPVSVLPAFVPALVTGEPAPSGSLAIELAGGCVLRWSGATTTEQLADLVHALLTRGER